MDISNFLGEIVQRYVYDAHGSPTIYDHEENQIIPAARIFDQSLYVASREYDPESGMYLILIVITLHLRGGFYQRSR